MNICKKCGCAHHECECSGLDARLGDVAKSDTVLLAMQKGIWSLNGVPHGTFMQALLALGGAA